MPVLCILNECVSTNIYICIITLKNLFYENVLSETAYQPVSLEISRVYAV